MLDVIEYIRSFFVPNRNKRKRSTADLIDEIISPSKLRKVSHCLPEDDWIIPGSRFHVRGTQMERKIKHPVIVLDEDGDDNVAVGIGMQNGTKPKAPISSSTPNTYSLFKSKGELNLSRASNNSNYFTPRMASKDLFHPTSSKKSGFALSNPASDYAFRLDEKQKYQQLISKSGVQSAGLLAESFANYYTPLAKTPCSRVRHMLDLAKSSHASFVDLADTDLKLKKKYGGKNMSSTGETILKVLDDTDDVVVVKDSDSEVEFLPTPPSPKPDLKIERVNSLKTLANTCEPMKENWIDDKLRKHREELQKFNTEMATRQSKLAELRRINEDIMRETLEKQVEKCLHIKEVVIPLEVKTALPELTAKQEQLVDFALDKRASLGAVLSSKFNLNITRRDMLTLAGLNWLNDEVINFYMNLLIERGKLNQYPNTYAFNTFFYPKILKDGQQSVRRWTRKVDVFAHDVLCVPIHLGMHWCMAIVDMRAKCVSYYDSMGKSNQQCVEAIFRYLQDEHAEKKSTPMDTKGWQLKCVRDIPQQMNGSDCGMFSCTYAEFAARNAPFTFSQEDMPYLRRKMVIEIMRGQLLIQ